MKIVLYILLGLSLVGGVGVAGYTAGDNEGYARGNSEGRKAGLESGYNDAVQSLAFTTVPAEDYNKLNEQYNTLVGDYNTLREAAIRYVGASSYQPRTPISCVSNTYGTYSPMTYTNCY